MRPKVGASNRLSLTLPFDADLLRKRALSARPVSVPRSGYREELGDEVSAQLGREALAVIESAHH